MTPLRKRMLEDLQLQGYAPGTQARYVGAVAQLAQHYHKSPAQITEAELRAYFLQLTQREHTRSTVKIALCGIKFVFGVTLQRPWPVLRLAQPPKQRRLPVVLSRQEVRAILARVRQPVYRVCLQTIYSCGLRISEGVALQVGDVDSQRMVLRVRGKGNKERQVPLAPATLQALREFWKLHRSRPWVFPQWLSRYRAQRPQGPIDANNLRRAFEVARQQSGVTKAACVHTLRHSYATHLLESGVQLLLIQEILGHRSPRTTTIYTHLTDQVRAQVAAPVQALASHL